MRTQTPDTETLLRVNFPSPGWAFRGLGAHVGDKVVLMEAGPGSPTRSFTQGPQQSNSRPFLVPTGWGFLPWEEGALWAESKVLFKDSFSESFSKIEPSGFQAGYPSDL